MRLTSIFVVTERAVNDSRSVLGEASSQMSEIQENKAINLKLFAHANDIDTDLKSLMGEVDALIQISEQLEHESGKFIV